MVKIRKSTIKLPSALQRCIKLKYIISIIQFGSSLHKKNYNDIDLAVVIKKDCYEKFLRTVYSRPLGGFDISLIKQEEISTPEKWKAKIIKVTINDKTKNNHFSYKKGGFPVAENFYNNAIKIPVWAFRSDERIVNSYIRGLKKVLKYIHNLTL